MRERDWQDYLFEHPAILFPDERVDAKQREVFVQGRRVDLLFTVSGSQYIVELKRDTITREAIGQVIEYYGLLRLARKDLSYTMVLAAPNVPNYLRGPLEEMGIRWVELSPIESYDAQSGRNPVRNRSRAVRAPLSDENTEVSWEAIAPPASRSSFICAEKFLRASVPSVMKTFAPFEVLPIRMGSSQSPDVLCTFNSENGKNVWSKAGAWWAFAFGHSETMPKNDVPNLSANVLPWGLDVGINAEIGMSSRVLRQRVAKSPDRFDALIEEHGALTLQAWLKLEHQPRFYHWILLASRPVGAWHAEDIAELHQQSEFSFKHTREHWVAKIGQERAELTEGQRSHLWKTNRNLNIAFRIVRTFGRDLQFWRDPFESQLAEVNGEYKALLPLVEFFV